MKKPLILIHRYIYIQPNIYLSKFAHKQVQPSSCTLKYRPGLFNTHQYIHTHTNELMHEYTKAQLPTNLNSLMYIPNYS